MKKYIMTIVLFHSTALYASDGGFVDVADSKANDPSNITVYDLELLKNSEHLFKNYDNGQLLKFVLVKHAVLAALYGSIANIVRKDRSQWILTAFPLAWTVKELYVTVRQAKTVWNRKFLKQQILRRCACALPPESIDRLKTGQDISPHLRIDPMFLDAIEAFRAESKNSANLNNF